MSRENEERARRGYEAFNAGDMDAVFESLAEDIEWEEWSMAPDAKTYYGHAGVREFFAKLSEAFDVLRFEPEEFIAAGNQTVVPTLVRVRGRGSGVETTLPTVHVWTLREDGKATRVQVYENRETALEAVGLAE